MARSRPAAGGGRRIEVAPERIGRWLEGFAERHGPLTVSPESPDLVRFRAADGALAECRVPFPPFPPPPWPARPAGAGPEAEGAGGVTASAGDASGGDTAGDASGGADAAVAALAAHACRARRVGVLLVRLGGHAAGVFDGARLVASKVGSRPVHGRSAAGGQSQARFARRRDNQARRALQAAADTAVRVLLPYVTDGAATAGDAPARTGGGGRLEALVCGGDRAAIEALRRDRRLAPVFALETGPFLTVPDPRRAVLDDAPRLFRAVAVRVVDP